MTKIIGKGVEELKKWIKGCKENKGILMLKTSFSGKKFNDRIIVSCYCPMKPYSGGTITNIPKDLIKNIRQQQENMNKITFMKIENLIKEMFKEKKNLKK